MRLTDRDAYWGAKLVTAFSDEQIAALVATARLPEADARYVDRGLRVRRDIIGRRYLRAVAAVENPTMSPDGSRICFEDLAIARGYAQPAEVRYVVEVGDGLGNRIASFEQEATGPAACVPIGGTDRGSGYRVVEIRRPIRGRRRTRRHPRRQGDARASALARRREPFRRRRPGEGRMTAAAVLALLIAAAVAPAAAAAEDPCARPGGRTCSRSALRRDAGRPRAGRAVDRPAGGPRRAGGAAPGDEGRVLADRRRPPTSSNTITSSTGGARSSRPTTAWSASVPSCSTRPASCRPGARASSTGACPARAARS